MDKTEFHLLIVDDQAPNIHLLARILEQEGYRMTFALNGPDALSLIARQAFDLILLDVVMADMDGFEVAQRLKADTAFRDIPIIFLSAKEDSQSKVYAFKVGAVDYVTKPFNSLELLARVKTHLELNAARERLKRLNEQLRQSEEKFRHLSIHDDLTGLFNTRYLYQNLRKMLDNAVEDTEFSLIFMDIDNFKRTVDTYGHLKGSQAIQEVAATIGQSILDPAWAVAYGGDEFVVVLPGLGKQKALQVAGDIRDRMKATVYLANHGHTVHLDVSQGIATYPDDAGDINGLLALADKAMFGVKEKGKDGVGHVCLAGTPSG